MSSQELAHNLPKQAEMATSLHKPPVSKRKIEANRKNARLSTGPKTACGKRTVARNAIKHGLLAREVVITAGEGEENQRDFDGLINGLWKDYEPVGTLEELLVQKIAGCWWRKARLLRAENGETRKRLDTARVDHTLRASDEANLDLAITHGELGLFRPGTQAGDNLSTRERLSMMQSVEAGLRAHEFGLAYQSALLRRAKAEITTVGYISEPIQRKLFRAFAYSDYYLVQVCQLVAPPVAKVGGQCPDNTESKQDDQDLLLCSALIDNRLKRINLFKEHAAERQELEQDAGARSFSLPPAEVTDKLIRYEAHLDRQLFRAMNQLERLQRLRNGENVPPPLNINLGKR